MRPVYFDRESRAIADLVELDPGYFLITRINVPKGYRSRGLASKLLKEILKDADIEGATLEIHPMPSGGLTRKELIAWYKRQGFYSDYSHCPGDPIKVLVRRPT